MIVVVLCSHLVNPRPLLHVSWPLFRIAFWRNLARGGRPQMNICTAWDLHWRILLIQRVGSQDYIFLLKHETEQLATLCLDTASCKHEPHLDSCPKHHKTPSTAFTLHCSFANSPQHASVFTCENPLQLTDLRLSLQTPIHTFGGPICGTPLDPST